MLCQIISCISRDTSGYRCQTSRQEISRIGWRVCDIVCILRCRSIIRQHSMELLIFGVGIIQPDTVDLECWYGCLRNLRHAVFDVILTESIRILQMHNQQRHGIGVSNVTNITTR